MTFAIGYAGQRYEVTCFDCKANGRVVVGWTNDVEQARNLATSCELRPSWKFAQVKDLHADGKDVGLPTPGRDGR